MFFLTTFFTVALLLLSVTAWEYRLSNSTSNNTDYGLLQTRPNATAPWGTVCNKRFNRYSAITACRTLGYNVTSARYSGTPGDGANNTSPIYLSEVACSATTRDLSQCSKSTSVLGCYHFRDVTLDCRGPAPMHPDKWEFRIAPKNKSVTSRGRLEMRPDSNSEWGTVCDDGFSDREALIACRSLGFNNISFAFALPFFGGGNGTIYLDDIKCPSSATYLQNCSYTYSTKDRMWTDCKHIEDIGIDCSGILPDANKPVIGYTVVSNVSANETVYFIVKYLHIHVSRVFAYHNTTDSKNRTVVQFRILDPPIDRIRVEVSRSQLDYYLLHLDPSGVVNRLHVISLTSNSSRHQRPKTWEMKITGSSPFAGLLSVRPNSTSPWGTVCGDFFDSIAATAACHSTGLNNATNASVILKSDPRNNRGSGPIYLDDTVCDVDAVYLQNCSYVYSDLAETNHNCFHSEDVTVNCFPGIRQNLTHPPAGNWEFKLDEGDHGVLLVRPSSVSPWGTVCDDYFNDSAALTACYSVGQTPTKARAIRHKGSYYTGAIYMDNVWCAYPANTSVNLTSCSFIYSTEFQKEHNCDYKENIAVDCRGPAPTNPNQWEFRIAPTNTNMTSRGRLEMRPDSNSTWGTVCRNTFYNREALAACHSAGFKNISFAVALRSSFTYSGNGTIYLSDLNCSSSATYLQNCSYTYSTEERMWNGCRHYEDIGVDCSGIVPVDNSTLIEFYAVINSSQTANKTMKRVASQFRVPVHRIVYTQSTDDSGNTRVTFHFTNATVDDLLDRSPQRRVLQYKLLLIDRSSVGALFGMISLSSNSTKDKRPPGLEFKLSDTLFTNVGRLMVRPDSNSPWGTVCDDYFNGSPALAACHSLGFNVTQAHMVYFNTYPNNRSGTGPIYLDDVKCGPSDYYLQNCSYVFNASNCGHDEDVWVVCGPRAETSFIDFRLTPVDSSDSRYGFLEVQIKRNGSWGRVCNSGVGDFDKYDALAACHTLGFSELKGASFSNNRTTNNDIPFYMSETRCKPGATNLTACGYYLYDPSVIKTDCERHIGYGAVMLECKEPPRFEFRIANGTRGLLEVRPKGIDQWGTVCSDGFDDQTALAVCRQMNFSVRQAYYIPKWGGGASDSPIYLDDVTCGPNVTDFYNCSYLYSAPGREKLHNCQHYEDVGIDCSGSPRPVRPPIAFTIVTRKPGATELHKLIQMLYLPENRVVVLSNTTNGTVGFRKITFVYNESNASFWTREDLEKSTLNMYDPTTRLPMIGILRFTNNASEAIKPTMRFRLMANDTDVTRSGAGRLEVLPDDEAGWGTVCDDGFDRWAAAAACHSLGFEGGNITNTSSYGVGQRHIFIDNTMCHPNDVYFQDCSFTYSDFNYDQLHDCDHSEDVAIQCGAPLPTTTTALTTTISTTTTAPASHNFIAKVDNITNFKVKLQQLLNVSSDDIVISYDKSTQTATFSFKSMDDEKKLMQLMQKEKNDVMQKLGVTSLAAPGEPLSPVDENKKKSGLSAGAIAGIVIAAIVVIVIIVAVVVVMFSRKARTGNEDFNQDYISMNDAIYRES